MALVLAAASLAAASTVGASGGSAQSGSALPKNRAQAKSLARAAALKDAAKAGGRVQPPKGKVIGYMHLSSQTEASVRMLNGLKTIAGIFGYKVNVCDPNFDPRKVAQCATSLVAQNPDIIIVEAADPGASGAGLREAFNKKIPWIVTGAQQTPSKYVTAQYVPDERELTRVLDTWFFGQIEKRVGKGTAAEIGAWQAPPVGIGVRARDTQRKQDLQRYPAIKETYTHDIDLSNAVQDTLQTTQQLVEQNPGIDGLWQTCDFCVGPMAQALDTKKLTGSKRPVLTGIYSTRETRQAIREGRVDGVVQNNFEAMGWVAMDQALEFWARGKKFHPNNSVFKKGYSMRILQPWIE
ncbi:MAG TPA: substrate-binding domain-containing protein, partial [Gaiellaceae bacterium]|nr:substrate-binding domain-containing protein [Gaiellaceae bacterium]